MNKVTYKEFIQNILDTRGRFACGEEYHERHHITPKCMGGTNKEENLIDLFAREHFIAHKLLAEENPENNSLVFAWTCMAFSGNRKQERCELTPDEYEAARKTISNVMSGENNPMYGTHRCGENNPMYGKHHLEESKEKISKATRERFKNPENHPMYGKHRSEKTRKKLSEVNKGKIILQFNKNIQLIKIWSRIKQAADTLNICRANIIKCCVGKLKTAGGYQWYYLYDQIQKDGTVIHGAITLGIITEEEALKMLNENEK